MAYEDVTLESPIYFAKQNISFYKDKTEPTKYPNNFEAFVPARLLVEANELLKQYDKIGTPAQLETELSKYRKLGTPNEIETALDNGLSALNEIKLKFGSVHRISEKFKELDALKETLKDRNSSISELLNENAKLQSENKKLSNEALSVIQENASRAGELAAVNGENTELRKRLSDVYLVIQSVNMIRSKDDPENFIESLIVEENILEVYLNKLLPTGPTVTLHDFQTLNQKRAAEFFDKDNQSVAHWTVCQSGEIFETIVELAKMGSSLNDKVKKMNNEPLDETMRASLAKELADIVTYAFVIASRFHINLGTAIIDKFNEVSKRIGSMLKIAR